MEDVGKIERFFVRLEEGLGKSWKVWPKVCLQSLGNIKRRLAR